MSAFLSPTNSACCRLCGVRKPWAELHHHGGFMNYRCKDPATCSTADLEITPGEVADMKDGSRAEDDELEWNRRRELSGIDDDPIERW